MTPKNPLWELGRHPAWLPSSWPSFASEGDLISIRGVKTAVLRDVRYWDELHAFLTGSSSRSLTALWMNFWSIDPDWTAVCRTLGSPDLRLETVCISCETRLTDEDGALLAAFLRSHTHEKLRLRNIGFYYKALNARAAEMIAEVFEHSDCKLEGFGICNVGTYRQGQNEKELLGNTLALGFAKALRKGKCNLRHLSLRCTSMPDKGLAVLFGAQRSNGCKLSELRWVCSVGVEALTSLTEHLRDASCQLQRLDISLGSDESMSILAQALQSGACKLVELMVRTDLNFTMTSASIASIAGALSSSRCRLQALTLHGVVCSQNPQLLVDALQTNLRLTFLEIEDLRGALCVRRDALLQRNRRLRDGELLERPQAKPHTAKLFICGHEGVGKTTVRKRLRRAKRPFRTINPRDLLAEEPRTRGMEFEQLSFTTGTLVMCDLAGQKEYHAFHHYFITGSDKDLFLVVCKDTHSTSQDDFEFQLQYWLRFILSHRTPGMPRPKVIVLVNFFHSRQSKENLSQVATSMSRQLMSHYKNDLDFGMPTNVFGTNARTVDHLIPVLGKLEVLLEKLLESRPRIPSICDDLLTIISQPSNKLKSILQSVVNREYSPYLPVGHIVAKYVERFCKDSSRCPPLMTFNAALVELHNSGQIIYFQPDDEFKWEQEIVIADCGWFCHNLIGALLEPSELRIRNRHGKPWIWRKEDVLKILRQQQPHAHEQQLEQVLRYLQCLELVYPIHHGNMNHISMESALLFPALLSETEGVLWSCTEPSMPSMFLGRRLECEDKDKTLLPSGVFTRLQVRLHSAYTENLSYKVGRGWISFVRDCVSTIIRFSGDSDKMEDCQWIDVMVSWLESQQEGVVRAEKIFCNVKTQILEICGGDRGCQGVALQESAMKEKDVRHLTRSSSVELVSLEALKKEIRSGGIACTYSWKDGTYSAIVDLLLPQELKDLIQHDDRAFRRIAEEFQIDDEETFISSLKQPQKLSVEAPSTWTPLSGDFEAFWQRFADMFQRVDARIEDMFQCADARNEERYLNIMGGMMHIRKDIGSLAKRFGQVEKGILSSCADKLLREVRLVREHQKGPMPAFLYFTDKRGVWHKMKGLFGEEVQLHIMCEWHAGPHPIDKQEGVPVMISSREWLVRAAPVLIPALKLFCCAARLAASIYLPGTQVFIPSPEWLDAFGLSGELIQQQILPAVLKTFVDRVSSIENIKATPQDLDDSKLRDLLTSLLKGKNINMETDFKLHRVEFTDKGRICWVCEEHCTLGEKLQNINPFS